jgi:hypothetical protein
MSSTATVGSLFRSLLLISAFALLSFSTVNAAADSTQGQTPPVKTITAAQPPNASASATTGVSTILKVSPAPLQPVQAGNQTTVPNAASFPATITQPPSASSSATTMQSAPNPAVFTPALGQTGAFASAVLPKPAPNPTAAVQPQDSALDFLSPVQRRRYQRAASAFTSFCQDWQRLLHDREVNNLEHLTWQAQGGLETASYTGYGKVESCECKASREGLPIGKIIYEEINYSLVGKTIEEAEHGVPKLMGEIKTLEIFSWEKDRWFY